MHTFTSTSRLAVAIAIGSFAASLTAFAGLGSWNDETITYASDPSVEIRQAVRLHLRVAVPLAELARYDYDSAADPTASAAEAALHRRATVLLILARLQSALPETTDSLPLEILAKQVAAGEALLWDARAYADANQDPAQAGAFLEVSTQATIPRDRLGAVRAYLASRSLADPLAAQGFQHLSVLWAGNPAALAAIAPKPTR